MPLLDELFPHVYDELRKLAAAKMAGEPLGHTLDATALVHEAYLKLGGNSFASRSGFFRAAATAMRRILIDHARQSKAQKRGGDGKRVELHDGFAARIPAPDTLLTLDDTINKLAGEDPAAAEFARLRLFTGLSVEEAADVLGLSRASAFCEWSYVRAWLSDAIARSDRPE